MLCIRTCNGEDMNECIMLNLIFCKLLLENDTVLRKVIFSNNCHSRNVKKSKKLLVIVYSFEERCTKIYANIVFTINKKVRLVH